jgi:hypothetical protein
LENHAKLALYFIGSAFERAPVDGNASAILRKHTAHNIYGCGFARAVFAEKGEKLAFAHAKA